VNLAALGLCGGLVVAVTAGFPAVPYAVRGATALALAVAVGPVAGDPMLAAVAGVLAGFGFSLPLRGLRAGLRLGLSALASGARELTDAALLVGLLGWMRVGGLEGLLEATHHAASSASSLHLTALARPEGISRLGRVVFAGAASGALPALAFAAALALVLGLAAQGRSRPPWQGPVVVAAGLVFLVAWLPVVPAMAGQGLAAGAAVVTGGTR
jgi:hypothetical protein